MLRSPEAQVNQRKPKRFAAHVQFVDPDEARPAILRHWSLPAVSTNTTLTSLMSTGRPNSVGSRGRLSSPRGSSLGGCWTSSALPVFLNGRCLIELRQLPAENHADEDERGTSGLPWGRRKGRAQPLCRASAVRTALTRTNGGSI